MGSVIPLKICKFCLLRFKKSLNGGRLGSVEKLINTKLNSDVDLKKDE